jgi:signal transduction histidine kinase
MHPAILTVGGLAAAIKDAAARSTLPVRIIELPSTRLDDTVEATAYYLFAEALTNAQKHARASSIRVLATTTTHALRLEVSDDGIGGADERAGSGLTGLRDRVEALGGTFDVASRDGHGTRITAAIPQR